ncbi:hypothetical protein [Pelagicoccus mobilis]|uniref:Uncharacterized protein n=1 Tax=Pelagicoccus mobilis TaxID=415221 RepID=A0A934VJB2_9BACT|nr:hypothetical protein [Pelagicoccus mobilis]MBK1875421.1 hypothetical protein [Pelagicoccus mobilis]
MKKMKPKEPKLLTLILTATSGVVLGGLLGISVLLSRSPVTVTTVPEEDEYTKVGDYNTYFTPGRVDAGESANLRSGTSRIKRRTNGPVSFSEAEVNRFFKNIKFGDPVVEEGGKKPANIGPFNVRISGDQIYATLKITVDPEGSPFEVLVLADLGFENSDAGPELVVNSLRVNSLPIPGFAGLVTSMIESKVAETPWPEDILEMWQNIKSIEVESGKLITEVGLRRA